MKKIFMTMMVAALTLGFYSCSSSDDDELETVVEQKQTDNSGDEETEEENSDAITYAATITNTELAAVLAEIIDGVTLDDNGYGLITQEAIDSTTELDISDRGLTSISGIEYFVNLTSLNCSDNPLTDFDISALTELKVLDCSRCFNQSSVSRSTFYLDLSAQIVLEELYCSENGLTELDLSANVALSVLYCNSNALVSLDLSANISLSILYCQENSLISLDLSVNVNLSVLVCYQNYLSYLDISANTNLSMVICGNQKDTSLELILNDEQKNSDIIQDDENNEDIVIENESYDFDDIVTDDSDISITSSNLCLIVEFYRVNHPYNISCTFESKDTMVDIVNEVTGKSFTFNTDTDNDSSEYKFAIYNTTEKGTDINFTLNVTKNGSPLKAYFYGYMIVAYNYNVIYKHCWMISSSFAEDIVYDWEGFTAEDEGETTVIYGANSVSYTFNTNELF